MNMAKPRFLLAVLAAVPLPAQSLKPASMQEFDCYVRSAEERMARQPALMGGAPRPDTPGSAIATTPGNGPNPHKIAGAMIYDWVGTVFIPGAAVERTVRMLQDYDHRARYFPEMISSARLLCRTDEDRFGFAMRLKEPSVIDTENDVVWERIDARHWRCRSYSTKVTEVGKQHGYLYRLNSYWRFAELPRGVYVEGHTITLSGEFGSLMRTLGSLAGINPEKSLRKTLASMRETMQKSGLEFSLPRAGTTDCGEPVRLPACTLSPPR